jgi:hypothetical protein
VGFEDVDSIRGAMRELSSSPYLYEQVTSPSVRFRFIIQMSLSFIFVTLAFRHVALILHEPYCRLLAAPFEGTQPRALMTCVHEALVFPMFLSCSSKFSYLQRVPRVSTLRCGYTTRPPAGPAFAFLGLLQVLQRLETSRSTFEVGWKIFFMRGWYPLLRCSARSVPSARDFRCH